LLTPSTHSLVVVVVDVVDDFFVFDLLSSQVRQSVAAAIELERTRRISEAPPRHSIVAGIIQREMGRREVLAIDTSLTAASSSATASLGTVAFRRTGAATSMGNDVVSEQTAALAGLETKAERLRKQLAELEEAIRSQTAVIMSADERTAFERRIHQVKMTRV
jgi:hypothetical protein